MELAYATSKNDFETMAVRDVPSGNRLSTAFQGYDIISCIRRQENNKCDRYDNMSENLVP